MAWLERKASSSPYRVVFRIDGKKVKRSLKTKSEKAAKAQLARIEDMLRLVETGRLSIPPGVDFLDFVMADGAVKVSLEPARLLTIRQLEHRFLDGTPDGSMESNTLATMAIHMRHIHRILGGNRQIDAVTEIELQEYVNQRSREGGRRGRKVAQQTIKMELATFRQIWNWGRVHCSMRHPFPNNGLRYPKMEDRPPFRTRSQIEKELLRSGQDPIQSELWECLFLRLGEVEEILELVRQNCAQPFLLPMCAMAAYTGARRSELLRSRVEDIDPGTGVMAIRERKRFKGQRSIRTVPISKPLNEILSVWLDQHPGGSWTFCLTENASRGLSVRQADYYLNFALRNTRWNILCGWHTFRHSFVSTCACRGVDQRVIDAWVGHLTDAMRRRYRHLFPHVERRAIELAFSSEGPAIPS